MVPPFGWSQGYYLRKFFGSPLQGAKKIKFAACHLGKVKLAFTSPNDISTRPKSFLTSRMISQFFFNLNSSKNITCPLGKLRTEFTSPIAKSTSPRYRTLLSLHTAFGLLKLKVRSPSRISRSAIKKYQ